jgi:hypothetical protein
MLSALRYYSPYPMPPDEVPMEANGQPPSLTSNLKRKLSLSISSPSTAGLSAHKDVKQKGGKSRTASDIFVAGVRKGGEGARGRLWVCDVGFQVSDSCRIQYGVDDGVTGGY